MHFSVTELEIKVFKGPLAMLMNAMNLALPIHSFVCTLFSQYWNVILF